MRRQRIVPPYIALSYREVVQEPAEGWLLSSSAGEESIINDRGWIPGWDQNFSFVLSRHFGFPSGLHERLMLSPAVRLFLVVKLRTANGLYSTTVSSQELDGSRLKVCVTPDSHALARDIQLEALLTLSDPDPAGSALAARVEGSILWSSTWRAKLEGGRSRLPMETVSFSGDPRWAGHGRALVHVELADDLALDCEEGLCVYLNADFPSFVRSVESDDSVARIIVWETVIRRAIISGLDIDVANEDSVVPDSLGDHLQRWSRGAFPGLSTAGIRKLLLDEPSRFEAAIQHWVGAGAAIFPDAGE